jgi:hypothetical protein
MGEWMYRSMCSWPHHQLEVSCQFHGPAAFPPGTHGIGGWVDPRAGLDDTEKWKFLTPPGLELRPLSRPARSQSLYRLRYPASIEVKEIPKLFLCFSVVKIPSRMAFLEHLTGAWRLKILTNTLRCGNIEQRSLLHLFSLLLIKSLLQSIIGKGSWGG